MPAAVIGGVIAAGGAVASASIASSGAKSAAQSAQQSADQASAVQQNIYNQNAATLAPYVQAGMPATSAINSLLGLGGTQRSSQTITQAPYDANYGADYAGYPFGGIAGIDAPGSIAARFYQGNYSPASLYASATQSSPQTDYNNAFQNYLNSTGYQFQLDQGNRAINSGYAGAGTLKSGAAMKAITDYNRNKASEYFNTYLGQLGNQQALGLSAASAQAGVGQNYANSLANIAMANGANQANAALVRSQNTAGLVNSLGGIAANIAGGLSTPSYGGFNYGSYNNMVNANNNQLSSIYGG